MTKIAIASCCKYQMQKVQPAWAEIEAENPDLLLLLGDNAYMRNSKWDHDYLADKYEKQFEEPNFKSLVSKVPFLATWDDHDFGVNDARGAEIEHWKREKSRKLFHKYMQNALNNNKPEVYASWTIDDLKIIMLDVRYYRERAHKNRPEATLLGETQEQWLWDQLAHNKKYTVIGSGTCLKDGAKNDSWDDYKDFYKRFRARIAQINRVLFLSGDIHRNKFVNHGDVFEIISSGVGRIRKFGKWPRQTDGKPMNNYGILDFGRTRVSVSLRGHYKRDRYETRIRSSSWTLID